MLTPSQSPHRMTKTILAAHIPNSEQTAAFMGTVMMCKLLNLSTCVLSVCCHKYCREMERPLAQQFIIPTIGSILMTHHWKDGALPEDDLITPNPWWLVQLSGCWQNWIFSMRSSNYGYKYHSVSHAGETMDKIQSKMRHPKKSTLDYISLNALADSFLKLLSMCLYQR